MLHDKIAIRPISVAIIKNLKGEILVSPGYDNVKKESFFRLLGGGIEFGESSLTALQREFKEELTAELIDCQLLKIEENIFSYQDEAGHEIIFIYKANFADSSLYEKTEFFILDSKKEGKAIWLDLVAFPESIIYPNISAWL